MSKVLRNVCLTAGFISLPVYYVDAKIHGRWDTEGVMLALGLIVLVIFEPPLASYVRNRIREKREREEADRKKKLADAIAARDAPIIAERNRREAEAEAAKEAAEKAAAIREAQRKLAELQKFKGKA